MSRVESRRERAWRRMVAADGTRNGPVSQDDWDAWQRAATDYWVVTHPEVRRLRRGDATATPTIEEMRERAQAVAHAMHGVPPTWRFVADPRERAEHLARVGWFHEQLAGLFGPVWDALARVRRGESSGIETLIRFLEADVYCFRSGYMKQDVIRFLTRAGLSEGDKRRLRGVVLAAVEGGDRREFRSYMRLARTLDSDALRMDLRRLASSPSDVTARHARWVLTDFGEKLKGEHSGR